MSQNWLSIAIIYVIFPYAFGDVTPVDSIHAKYLVSISFPNDHYCIGALVGRLTIATSRICMERYNFASRLYRQPCKVYAGIKVNLGKDMGIWRFCVGNEDVYKIDEYHGSSVEVYVEQYESEVITIDLPFDNIIVTKATVDKPTFRTNENCSIYGFIDSTASEQPAPATDSEQPGEPVKPTNGTAGHSAQLFRTTGTILEQKQCEVDYREYMDRFLPDDYFCVLEGGIPDEGRILVCNDKVVGMVADDLAIVKRGNNTMYAYTHVRAVSPSWKYPGTFVLLICFILQIKAISFIFTKDDY